MHLIQDDGNGNFSLVEQDDDNIPRYAILSHTWGANREEVTFKDLIEGSGENKAGYNKIKFCGKQANRDGLHFFWVDTCCIDKSSSAELTEAINSMFRWYQNAHKCYVYLSDVSTSGDAINDKSRTTTWEAAFQQSRWFYRGWTLQELIAPASVEFFSQEGDRLGDKRSLEEDIVKVTEIPSEALRGSALTGFEVNERLSWAKHRETKKPEDSAYSLLGLFDVHMPLIYGEGREKAFTRLQEEISKSLIPDTYHVMRPTLDSIADDDKAARQLLEQASYEKGVKLLQKVVDDQRAIHSSEESLLISLSTLQWAYWKANDKRRAENIAREALDILERTRGPNDKQTLHMMQRIADNLSGQGRKVECESLHEIIKSRREQEA